MKIKKLYIYTLVVFIAIASSFYLWEIRKNDSTVINQVPESVIALTDNYIIENVGSDYFKSQYRHLPNKDSISAGSVEYIVKYEYLAASSIAGRSIEASIAYYPSTNVTRANYGVYSCLQDPTLCDFSLTKNQAIDIAKGHGLLDGQDPAKPITTLLTNFNPTKSNSVQGWYWEVSFQVKSDSSCVTTRIMYVHIPDGDVGQPSERESCI